MLRLAPLAVLFLAACSSSRAPAPSVPVETPVTDTVIDHAAYETFDPVPYAVVAGGGAADAGVQHDAPAALLENRAGATETSTEGRLVSMSGYRVQVLQATNKDEADRVVNDVIAWWRREHERLGLEDTPAVYTYFRAPYYRVRVGNFESRTDADAVRRELVRLYPSSFVVPDRVSVRQ